jgi:hypothetical protein
MSTPVSVSTRQLARRKKLLEDWSISLPPIWFEGGEGGTLRDLITQTVVENVEMFKKRQEANRFHHVLTSTQIQAAVDKGKVDMGGRKPNWEVDTVGAVGTAIQAFEDGIYLVIIDGIEYRDLDAQVYLQPDSQIVFLRLVMLAGG